ncbi:EpsG family protein [Vibrio vulnificus]|nr:EpsG family protein [Vibrio vulnificus]
MNLSSKASIDLSALLILILLSGYSYGNGWDYYNYYDFYEFIDSHYLDGVYLLLKAGIEPGYLGILFVINSFGLDYQFAVLSISVVSNLFLFFAVRKLGFDFLLFSLVFLSTYFLKFELSTIRQGVAISIVLLSYCFILKGNKFKYFSFILLASSFHYSALVMLFFPVALSASFFYSKRFSILLILFAFPFFFLTIEMRDAFFSIVQQYFTGSSFIIGKLITYFNRGSDNSLPLVQVYSCFIYFICLYYFADFKDEKQRIIILLSNILLIVQFYLKFLPSIVTVRLEYYFIYSHLFCLMIIIDSIRRQFNVAAFLFSTLIVCIVSLVITLRNPLDRKVYLPYYSIFHYIHDEESVRSREQVKYWSLQY